MSLAEGRFWRECTDYHSFVEDYERNISVTHPDYVTSNRLAPFTGWSSWTNTAVKYYDEPT